MKPPFDLRISGDFLDIQGNSFPDLGLDRLAPKIKAAFLKDQQPTADEPNYQDRLYSLETTPEHVAMANGIIILRPWVRASAFSAGAERLTAIGRCGIGYDKIDLKACTENDVVVFNSPYGLTHSTASAAMLFILALSKRLGLQEQIVQERRWDRQTEATGNDLASKTLGVVGFGQTGRELVRLLAPYQMRVIAYSPHADPKQAADQGVTLVESLDVLLKESDYVSLHGRLTPATHGMIGERELSLMKPSAYFINVARGEMVDEKALVQCLKEKRIAGAGLDVFENEPLNENDPLLLLDNVILTPHWLCSTHEAGRETVDSILEGMMQVAQGRLPENILNRSVLDRSGFQAKLRRFA